MRKGVTLSVWIYVEGEAPPEEDFAATAQNAIGEVVKAGMASYTGPYQLTVRRVEALEGSSASDEG
jgi:hypothetical protein